LDDSGEVIPKQTVHIPARTVHVPFLKDIFTQANQDPEKWEFPCGYKITPLKPHEQLWKRKPSIPFNKDITVCGITGHTGVYKEVSKVMSDIGVEYFSIGILANDQTFFVFGDHKLVIPFSIMPYHKESVDKAKQLFF